MLVELRDDARIASFLEQDPTRHVYALGDLEPPFRARSHYVGWVEERELVAVALRYDGGTTTTWHWQSADPRPMNALVAALEPKLPDRFYLHASAGVELASGAFTLEGQALHLRMHLASTDRLAAEDTSGVECATVDLADELGRFYDRAFPGHWHDPRTLPHGVTTCWRDDTGVIRAAAGIHVVAPTRRVAALGNVAVDPEWRGRGLGRRVTAATTRRLCEVADVVALNVAASNAPARSIYERLGFALWSDHLEGRMVRAPMPTLSS